MRASARARMTIAFKQDAEAVEREQVVDLANVMRVGGDHASQAASSDHAGLLPKLGEDALQYAIDQADISVVEAALQVADGVGSDDLCGPLDVYAAQPGSARKERFGAQPQPRC